MPPVAAAAAAIGPALSGAVGAIGAATGVYSVVEGARRAKKAESAAEEFAQRQWELQERQAGEHFDLSEKQMKLQKPSCKMLS